MRRLLKLYTVLVLAFLYLPIAVIVVLSFNQSRFGVRWTGFTWDWYLRLFHHHRIAIYAENTLIVAVVSTLVATLLGTLLALGLYRYTFFGKGALRFLLYVPVVIPDIVMGVALLLFFAWVRQHTGWLRLSLATIVLGHVTFQIAYVALVVRSRLAGLDPALEEAAQDLGAGSYATFRYVTLPLILPGILAGALLAFTLSLDDFVITFFTAGPGSTTLPLYIFSSVKRGVTPEIHALSSILIAATTAGLLLGRALLRRR
jgi:spermidine/putrescine transport system permease protein